MGKAVETKTIVRDDLDGSILPEDTAPVTVSFDGKKYEVYMSAKSTERFVSFLNGSPLLNGSTRTTTRRSSGSSSAVNTYGHDTKDVRAWAIANKVKQGTKGTPVGDRGRISQSVYDAYNDAHK